MTAAELVFDELKVLRKAKGLDNDEIHLENVLLGEELGLDSLDLATLVVNLEERSGLRPFESGFVMFRTVGELIELFSHT